MFICHYSSLIHCIQSTDLYSEQSHGLWGERERGVDKYTTSKLRFQFKIRKEIKGDIRLKRRCKLIHILCIYYQVFILILSREKIYHMYTLCTQKIKKMFKRPCGNLPILKVLLSVHCTFHICLALLQTSTWK